MTVDISHQRHVHRPAPLAPSSSASGAGRSQLLTSLRTARPTGQMQTANRPPPSTPQMLTAFELQQQANFIALQQQILLQQQQLILAHQQQQVEAEAAMRAMRLSTEPNEDHAQDHRRGSTPPHQLTFDGRTSLLVTQEDEEAVRDNPLAASALARRKRQSFSLEPTPATTHQQQSATTLAGRRVSYGGPQPVFQQAAHHRRASSTASAMSHSQHDLRSPTRSWSTGTDATPAVILSAPGEPFPSPTSSTEEGVIVASTASASPPFRHARRVSVEVRSSHSKANSISSTGGDEGRIAPWLEGIKEATSTNAELSSTGAGRRPSQAVQLTAALSGRRQRPASMTGPPAGMLPIETQGLSASHRTVSDSATTPFALSPFATTYQPLPATPRTPPSTAEMMTAYAGSAQQPYPYYQQDRYLSQQQQQSQQRHSPPPNGHQAPGQQRVSQPGTATAIRQPRGPESDLGASNFATRLRKRAIATLLRAGPDARAAAPRLVGFAVDP